MELTRKESVLEMKRPLSVHGQWTYKQQMTPPRSVGLDDRDMWQFGRMRRRCAKGLACVKVFRGWPSPFDFYGSASQGLRPWFALPLRAIAPLDVA